MLHLYDNNNAAIIIDYKSSNHCLALYHSHHRFKTTIIVTHTHQLLYQSRSLRIHKNHHLYIQSISMIIKGDAYIIWEPTFFELEPHYDKYFYT